MLEQKFAPIMHRPSKWSMYMGISNVSNLGLMSHPVVQVNSLMRMKLMK